MNFKNSVQMAKEDMILHTCELIRIKSMHEENEPNMPFGSGVNDALCYVLDLAEGMGFRVKNLDGYCGYAEYGEGDLYIGVLSHVDTCEEGTMWGVEPFGGTILDNKIYGRGAMDNKGPLIAALYALKAVKDSGKTLNKKVRLIIGTDEERYYKDMAYYLSQEKPPIVGFTLDGQFPVVFAEKGLAMLEFHKDLSCDDSGEKIQYIRGGSADNTVPGYCEALLITQQKSEIVKKLNEFSIKYRHNMEAKMIDDGVVIYSYGVETHSMILEMGKNAISQMIDFLVWADFGQVHLKNIITFLHTHIGFYLYGEGMGVVCEDDFSGKLTTNLGILNFNEGKMDLRIDIRYPVMCNFEATLSEIENLFHTAGLVCTEKTYWDPIYFPKDHFLIKALLKSYQKVTKDMSDPIASGSGSYSKVMPNIAAFGAIFPGESQAWHQKNESIHIDNLVKMCEIYATAIFELGNV